MNYGLNDDKKRIYAPQRTKKQLAHFGPLLNLDSIAIVVVSKLTLLQGYRIIEFEIRLMKSEISQFALVRCVASVLCSAGNQES